MAWTTIPTLTTGAVAASHFNLLHDNADMLAAIAQRSNVSAPSVHGNTLALLNENNHLYAFRHMLRYLHYEVENLTNTLAHLRIFYGGWKVAQDPTPAVTPFAGVADLQDPGSWPNYVGAWATATAYEANVGGDGEIVAHGGAHYRCILDHTSGASTEPGVGASWTSYWQLFGGFTVGQFYDAYVDAAFGTGNGELACNYLIEREYA